MDYINFAVILGVAIASGFLFKRLGLPPMIGYLISGFILGEFNLQAEWLDPLAHIGVILLLFTIGLKLELRTLAMPQVWLVTGVHMAVSVVGLMVLLKAIAVTLGSSYLEDDWSSLAPIAFALSFSSTVFAVKVLEDRGESNSLHGIIAIGVLVMQDLIAVGYLAASKGAMPNLWALTIPLVILVRPLLLRAMAYCGHGELLILLGFGYAFGGVALFEIAGIKGDLGALFMGVVLAGHIKSRELTKSLPKFKEVLLIGFFLTVGKAGFPDTEAWILALILTVAIFAKPLLYFLFLTRLKLRARSALLSSLALANFSEFGLIVAALAASSGLIDNQWPAIIALAIMLSFLISAQLNNRAHDAYEKYGSTMRRFETKRRLSRQQPFDIGPVEVLVFGMGRIGTGAYDYLYKHYGDVIAGLDESAKRTRVHTEAGRRIHQGDGTDRDFLIRLDLNKVRLIMLAMSNHAENIRTINTLHKLGYNGTIAATAHFTDEQTELTNMGVKAFNVYDEAGTMFAEHIDDELNQLTAETKR